jgi:hypothetical protein
LHFGLCLGFRLGGSLDGFCYDLSGRLDGFRYDLGGRLNRFRGDLSGWLFGLRLSRFRLNWSRFGRSHQSFCG